MISGLELWDACLVDLGRNSLVSQLTKMYVDSSVLIGIMKHKGSWMISEYPNGSLLFSKSKYIRDLWVKAQMT